MNLFPYLNLKEPHGASHGARWSGCWRRRNKWMFRVPWFAALDISIFLLLLCRPDLRVIRVSSTVCVALSKSEMTTNFKSQGVEGVIRLWVGIYLEFSHGLDFALPSPRNWCVIIFHILRISFSFLWNNMLFKCLQWGFQCYYNCGMCCVCLRVRDSLLNEVNPVRTPCVFLYNIIKGTT